MAFHSVSTLSSRAGRGRRGSGGEQPAAPGLHRGVADERRAGRPAQDRAALPVAALPHAEEFGHGVDHGRVAGTALGDRPGHLVRGPHVEAALVAVGVGVLGRVHPPLGGRQVAVDVPDDLVHDHQVVLPLRDLPGVEVGAQQGGLVVEHLLEVGDQPLVVGRVAGEPAPEVVVDPAGGHGVQRGQSHPLGTVPVGPTPVAQGVMERQVHQHGLGELGRSTEPAPLGVEACRQVFGRHVQEPEFLSARRPRFKGEGPGGLAGTPERAAIERQSSSPWCSTSSRRLSHASSRASRTRTEARRTRAGRPVGSRCRQRRGARRG